jgi:hypothetical protein
MKPIAPLAPNASPTHAETVRTLVAGQVPGQLHIPGHDRTFTVRHATDPAGNLLLLMAYQDPAAHALRAIRHAAETPVTLTVDDTPPVPGAPIRGRAWVSGWATPLAGDAARDAAMDFATTHVTGDLLLLGSGFVLYRVEVDAVRLRHAMATLDLNSADYAQAAPDAIYPQERMLLATIARHHWPALLHSLTPGSVGGGLDPASVVPIRLDRYGLLVEIVDHAAGHRSRPPRRVRMNFAQPVADPADLIALLDAHDQQ